MAQTGAERVERHRQKQRARIEELEGQLADALARLRHRCRTPYGLPMK